MKFLTKTALSKEKDRGNMETKDVGRLNNVGVYLHKKKSIS